jgi:hypothetical protein
MQRTPEEKRAFIQTEIMSLAEATYNQQDIDVVQRTVDTIIGGARDGRIPDADAERMLTEQYVAVRGDYEAGKGEEQ